MTTARPPFGQKIVPIFWPAGKTEVFSGKLKSRRQAPHGVFISPTLGYFNYGPTFTEVFSGKLPGGSKFLRFNNFGDPYIGAN
jgi:hypothetical protein